MPHEAIVDVVAGLAEVGASAVSNSDNKKSGLGCLLITIVLVLICLGVYFIFSPPENTETRGLITKKLPDDKMVIKTEDGEDIHTINHELYLNKQEGDSIILNN